jgi:hypothetical protein
MLLHINEKFTMVFNFTFCYIDDVLPLNNSRFGYFVDRIYPIELEMKDTTYTHMSASHSDGRLRTKLYDKRDDSMLEHVDDVSFREHLGRMRADFYKIRSVSSIYVLSFALCPNPPWNQFEF